MIRNTLATDDLDYQLAARVNSSYGIGVTNAAPVISGATIPKIRAGGVYTSNIHVYGSVQTPLTLSQPITTESGNLVLTSATGRIDFGGSTFSNYTTPPQNRFDFSYQGSTPSDPVSSTLRVYANNSGLLSWKTSTGITARLDTSALSASRVFALPDADMDIVGTNTTNVLTNKTIDTAGPNTIRIGGTSVTSLIGQAVLTSSSPSFVSSTLTGRLTANTSSSHPITVNQSGTTTGNDLMFQKTSVNVFSIGTNETSNETYSWTPSARDYKIGTNNIERLRILSTGVSTDNTSSSVLGLQGTTLVYKSNLADTSSTQIWTNKTIDTAGPNTIQIAGTNVTSLIGQDVRSTASPTFNVISMAGGFSEFGGKVLQLFANITTTTTGSNTLATVPVALGTTKIVSVYLMVFCSAGIRLNESTAHRIIFSVNNISGTIASVPINNVITGTISTGLAVSDGSGGNAIVLVQGIATSTVRWTAYIEVYTET